MDTRPGLTGKGNIFLKSGEGKGFKEAVPCCHAGTRAMGESRVVEGAHVDSAPCMLPQTAPPTDWPNGFPVWERGP